MCAEDVVICCEILDRDESWRWSAELKRSTEERTKTEYFNRDDGETVRFQGVEMAGGCSKWICLEGGRGE